MGVLGVPVLVNAPVFLRKAVRAVIPFLVPRISVSMIVSEMLCSMWRCWLYLGHSRMMCSLVWNVWLSQGHMWILRWSGEGSFYETPLCMHVLFDIVLVGQIVPGRFVVVGSGV